MEISQNRVSLEDLSVRFRSSGEVCREQPEDPTPPSPLTIDQQKQLILREHTLLIDFKSIGCVVQVGCKQIPFTSNLEALEVIAEYIKNPNETKAMWLSKLV